MNLEVSTEQVRQTAADLKRSASEMESNLNQIKTLMEKVGSAGIWTGASAAASRDEFDRLAAKFPSFSEAVQNCSNGLTQFANNYDETENKIKNALN